MDFEIEIATKDSVLIYDLMEKKEAHSGMVSSVASGATLRLNSHLIREAFGVPEILQLTLSIGKDVAIEVFAAWLYDKLKGRAIKLEIDQTEIQIDKGEIKKIIIKKIKQST